MLSPKITYRIIIISESESSLTSVNQNRHYQWIRITINSESEDIYIVCFRCLLLFSLSPYLLSDQAELCVTQRDQRLQLGQRRQRQRFPWQLRLWGDRGRWPVIFNLLLLTNATRKVSKPSWARQKWVCLVCDCSPSRGSATNHIFLFDPLHKRLHPKRHPVYLHSVALLSPFWVPLAIWDTDKTSICLSGFPTFFEPWHTLMGDTNLFGTRRTHNSAL